MKTDEQLYTLMAQAEDLQAHAEKLQNSAQEAFAALPLAVEQAGKKIRSTGLQAALIVVSVGMVASAVAIAGIWWGTSRLRDEAARMSAQVSDLRNSIAAMEVTAAQLEQKTWRLEFEDYGKEGRGIVLPKGIKFVRSGKVQDGRDAIVIKP